MSLARDVFAELVGMFVADAPLSPALLCVVRLAAMLIELQIVNAPGLLAGAVLTFGVVAVLFEAVLRTARAQSRSGKI